MTSKLDLVGTLRAIANEYPEKFRARQLADVDRTAFQIRLVTDRQGINTTVCDICGGHSMFSVGCAAIGMRAIVVDDFADPRGDEEDRLKQDILDTVHRKYGVELVRRDVIEDEIVFEPGGVDCFTSFEAMEHFHHSPKRLFAKAMSPLTSRGLFTIGVPNCVNLRKRITVPLGYGKWSSMNDWYESERFRGHVREPDVGDLRYIAGDLDLRDVRIYGRNWIGYISPSTLTRIATHLSDRWLRPFPTLCSDIYLVGRKA